MFDRGSKNKKASTNDITKREKERKREKEKEREGRIAKRKEKGEDPIRSFN